MIDDKLQKEFNTEFMEIGIDLTKRVIAMEESKNELSKGIIETQKLQTETIKELMGICTELVDRVKTLEEEVKK